MIVAILVLTTGIIGIHQVFTTGIISKKKKKKNMLMFFFLMVQYSRTYTLVFNRPNNPNNQKLGDFT